MHTASEAHDPDTPLLAEALARAVEGWAVHPLFGIGNAHCECSRGARCPTPAKHPRLTGWQEHVTRDPEQIRKWWTRWPHANIGGAAGKKSGRVVLDIDPRNGGDVSLELLEAAHGAVPDTQEVITGSGGRHLYFQDPDVPLGNTSGVLGPGLDIKETGGNVVLPGSMHISGRAYEYEVTHGPEDVPLAPMPAWLLTLLRSRSNGRTGPRPVPEPGPIPNGTAHYTFVSWAGTMHKRGMSPAAILAALQTENRTRCDPVRPEENIRQIVSDITTRYESGPIPEEESEEPEDESEALPAFPNIAWRGAFQTYREAMAGTTEAADVTHFAAFWAAVAVRLRRRVQLHYGMTLYANVYLVVYGPTGDRKTTGTRRTLNLLPEGGPVKVLRGVGSGEGIADWLSTDGAAPASHLLFLEELSELLTRGRWDGATLISFLTHVFDCPDGYELKYRKNPITLTAPALSLLTCTTPALFWQHIREVDIHNGFANRMCYLTGPVKEPIALPAKPDFHKLATVHEALTQLDSLTSREATLSTGAVALWEQFYKAWRETDLDPLTKAATERVPAYCLKLAMTYAALEGTLPEIGEKQLKAAIAVGRYATHCTKALIGQRTATSRQGTCEEAILKVLSLAPCRGCLPGRSTSGRGDSGLQRRT